MEREREGKSKYIINLQRTIKYMKKLFLLLHQCGIIHILFDIFNKKNQVINLFLLFNLRLFYIFIIKSIIIKKIK